MNSSTKRIAAMGLLALAAALFFMFQGLRGDLGFVLGLRGGKLLQLCLVAHAVAMSTLLFQTISGTRILTPAVMGFDSLYVLLQTLLFGGLGALLATKLPAVPMFVLQLAAMLLFAVLLYQRLFGGDARSLHLMVLTGIVLSQAFRSAASFVQGAIDPNEFVVLQSRLFADFSTVKPALLLPAAVVIAVATLLGLRRLRELDVLALGRDGAINLGVDYRRAITAHLLIVALLVGSSTALVGPVTFFGLLVVHLAFRLVPTQRHGLLLPAASLLAMATLIAGQWVLERLLSFGTALSMVIEFAGGLLFLVLLLKGRKQ